MLKQFLTGGFILALLLVNSLSAQAQPKEPGLQPQVQETPSTRTAAPDGSTTSLGTDGSIAAPVPDDSTTSPNTDGSNTSEISGSSNTAAHESIPKASTTN
jgi:hypothetical protein